MSDENTHGFYVDRGHRAARALIRGSESGVRMVADRFNAWYETDIYKPRPIEEVEAELKEWGIPTRKDGDIT